MYNYNIRKNKRILFLFLLTITIGFLNLSQFIWNFNNSLTDPNSPTEFELDNELKTSDYSSSYNGTGENMNITLHQSYLDESFNTILNTSLVDGNNFTIPCPTDTKFNSSYTRFEVEDIIAPNKSIIVEDAVTSAQVNLGNYYASFEVIADCWLENISVLLFTTGIATTFTIDVFAAKEDSGDLKYDVTKDLTGGSNLGAYYNDTTTNFWLNLTNRHVDLDVDNTVNNTFFLQIYTGNGQGRWRSEGEINNGGNDDNIVWDGNFGVIPEADTDLTLKVGLSPKDETPAPTEVDLRINNDTVSDIADQLGYWESIKINGSDSGSLHYNVTADWWDVECVISQVQINYTKTNLVASSQYLIAGSLQTVNWTVTAGSINHFETDLDHYWMNFTVPAKWTNFKAFNDTKELTDNTTLGPPQGGYKEYQIYNMSNGPNWYITANSTNLLYDMRAYTDTGAPTKFNFTNIVHFDANFSKVINDGLINLTVYSPATINNLLNYSLINNNSFVAGDDIYFGDWNISKNVTRYGVFRIKLGWNNNTDAGFLTDTITIIADTSLEILNPQQDITYNSDRIFNITVSYNDTGQNKIISDANIYYSINDGNYSPVNESVTYVDYGEYNINFDCNNSAFKYGTNNIKIKANGTYYNEKVETFNFKILGLTNLTKDPIKASFDSTETFNVSLFFNDTVKESGISGATYTVYVSSSLYNPIDDHDYGAGYYNITIDCDDDVFATQGYGDFNLSVYIEKDYYYNHTAWYIIEITGNTSLTAITIFPDPAIGYYNSDEMFNITAYFEDVGRSEGIEGGQLKVYVKPVSVSTYEEYTTVSVVDINGGNYNITIDCSDNPPFYPYNKYDIKINISKSNYYSADDFLEKVIVGNTTLTILEPTMPISYLEGETFDIMIEYEDHTLSTRITGANITYTIDGTNFRSDNISPNVDDTYNITINTADSDFGFNFGSIDIIIRANKSKYINLTRTLNFERQIITQLTPLNPPSLIEVMRGNSIFYEFNYSDRLGNPIDTYTTFQNSTELYNFQWSIINEGVGNYTLELNTTNVLVTGVPYTINFSIYEFGKQSQEISFTIQVTIIQTNINIESWNEFDDFARSTRLNISIDFYFNDTTNNMPITGLVSGDIRVNNNDTGSIWSPGFELFDRVGDGNYKLNISTIGATSGFYTLQVNISKFPNYNWDLVYIQFYLRGNYTQIHLISMSDPGGILIPEGANYNFTIFEGSDINIEFNLTDSEFADALVLGDADSYALWFTNLHTPDNGALLNTLHFVYQTIDYGTHVGQITTSSTALTPGNYLLNITITKTNYESTYFTFNLTVIEKFQVQVNITNPLEVEAGDTFTIILNAEYFNGSLWLPLAGTDIIMTPYFNEVASTEIQTKSTNSTGGVSFQITVRSDARSMNISFELQEEYYHYGFNSTISNIDVNPLPSGLNFEDFILYLIIAGAVLAAVGSSIGIYRGVVVPKKREKSRVLKEVKTIFDDAISLEHILVLYKGTGTCIYFKSFGSEGIDPELISGFISAICSFGKDLVCQEELNEITYGDKMLLLSDGEYIRVALVLSKKASIILRKNLMDFINSFEKSYANDLPNWRGQLNLFRNAGLIIDEILSTSIILPHEITYKSTNVKALKNPHSKDVLKIATNMMKESDRNFFFIATLLKESSEKTNKDTAEIFMGIKELRDNKILIPIEIGSIEAQPISQQEMTLINQKIGALTHLSQEEKQKLANDLAQLGPAEREAYFVSLSEQHEIVSAPIEEKPGTALIDSMKGAKKEIKNLKKIAKDTRKEKDYTKTINIYENAVKIATNWELMGEIDQINELTRLVKIEDLSTKMKTLEKEAKLAAKKECYREASQKYKMSSRIASEIFKLGGTEMTKEVKRLSNKSKEFEKLI